LNRAGRPRIKKLKNRNEARNSGGETIALQKYYIYCTNNFQVKYTFEAFSSLCALGGDASMIRILIIVRGLQYCTNNFQGKYTFEAFSSLCALGGDASMIRILIIVRGLQNLIVRRQPNLLVSLLRLTLALLLVVGWFILFVGWIILLAGC
jgi:hypothetical protein